MAALFAYFDESGKFKDHKIVSFCGFVADFQQSESFAGDWRYLLRRNGLKSLHTTRDLNSPKLSSKNPARGQVERLKVFVPFVATIRRYLRHGIYVAVDVEAFRNLPSHASQALKGDPYYLGFYKAVGCLLDYANSGKRIETSLIIDQEEKYGIKCFEFLTKMKLSDPAVRETIVSFCFGDADIYPNLQAADLFAYLTRSEALRRFHHQEYWYRDLYTEMNLAEPTVGDRQFVGGFYGKEELDSLAAYLAKKKGPPWWK